MPPNWPRVWTLDSRAKGARGKADTIKQKVCTECTQPYLAFLVACPYCGAVPQPTERSSPDKVDGDLFQLPGGAAKVAIGGEYSSYKINQDTVQPNGLGAASLGPGTPMAAAAFWCRIT